MAEPAPNPTQSQPQSGDTNASPLNDPGVQPSKTAPPQRDQTNVRETVESILVAFILAFIFRAFVVEAFVIPTGSMAPTLLGAHMRFYCPDCGYEFATNYSSPRSNDTDIVVPQVAEGIVRKYKRRASGGRVEEVEQYEPRVFPIHCPNCGFKFPETSIDDPDNDATSPPIHHGDRILVMKYVYLINAPQRWDVVVFKSPVKPEVYDYTQNYIKRLVGRPGEVVMLLDGDVYVAPNRTSSGDDPPIGEFKIQRKPDDVQDALWRVVYDNDYHPRSDRPMSRPRTWAQPWHVATGQGWTQDADGGRTFRFQGAADSRSTLRFDIGPTADVFPLQDFLGYNQTGNFPEKILLSAGNIWNQPLMPPRHVVDDLKLGVTYRRESGNGPLRLRLSKGTDLFTAECLPDRVRLLRSTTSPASGQTTVAEAPISFGHRPARVEIQNIDYRVSVRIDSVEILATGDDYAPDPVALNRQTARKPIPIVEIEAAGQAASVNHVRLLRDIHYLNLHMGMPTRWASPTSPIHLGPDEYFVCGDNSEMSWDARLWNEPINLPGENLQVQDGRVPGRFLLGKAFFVYWPAGYRPVRGLPGLAPNFGQMRFIH
jgi:signal peptidase I